MTRKEINERSRLHKKFACGKATKREILRCMELDRRKTALDNMARNIESCEEKAQ